MSQDLSREERMAQQRQLRRKRRRLQIASRIVFCAFLGVFVTSAWMLIDRKLEDHRSRQSFDELSSMLESVPDPGNADLPQPGKPSPEPGKEPEKPIHPQTDSNGVLVRYSKLYARNPDLFGWISIPDTVLDYPVMRTPEDEEYYLRRGFDGTDNRSGVPFVDVDCTEEGFNWIVYGHNMQNGTMFQTLESYASEDFWREHPVIRFDTLYREGTYEVMAAFHTRVFYQNETEVFRYYNYDDLSDPKDYADYAAWMKENSLYETGVDAEYGDRLLTLITCESRGPRNNRFVVVAREIP